MAEVAVTVDHAIEVLNRIHKADPTVMPALVDYRVECNEQVADDPTVQVRSYPGAPGPPYMVGLLGVLNGIFGTQPATTIGYIAACYEDGELTGFRRNE